MPKTADRLTLFTESVIREMTRVANQYGAINLSQGFPDADPPPEVLAAGKRAMAEGPHQYAVTWGAPRFREALARKQKAWMGLDLDPDAHLVVTCGSTEAMMTAMMTACNPGDKVVIFSPYYENYGADTILSGAQPIYVPLHPPDFNFDLALFYNMGDKGYANRYFNGSFYIESGWQETRAKAIAWCIENGALPYNHFYNHPNLSLLTPDQILWQLEENETALREALRLVGKPELAKIPDNILALPYVIWPETDSGKQVLFDYQSPEGKPVSAILEANDGAHVRPILPPFAKSFDPHHVKRLNAIQEAIDAIIQKADEIPTASHCDLGEIPADSLENPLQIKQAILKQIRQGNCTNGYYTLGQFAFYVEEVNVIQLSP